MQSLTKKRKARTEKKKKEMIKELVLMEAACASIALGDIGRKKKGEKKEKRGGREKKKKADTATNN